MEGAKVAARGCFHGGKEGGNPPGGLAYVGECLIDWRSSHDN